MDDEYFMTTDDCNCFFLNLITHFTILEKESKTDKVLVLHSGDYQEQSKIYSWKQQI